MGNFANLGGGVSSSGSISFDFERVLILGNEANSSVSSKGGFAYFMSSGTSSLFINCVIAGNKSAGANGVIGTYGSNRFVNCTIVGNQAGGDGGIAFCTLGIP